MIMKYCHISPCFAIFNIVVYSFEPGETPSTIFKNVVHSFEPGETPSYSGFTRLQTKYMLNFLKTF